ncbi:N-formylglutamate amidohydrolase [Rhodococcus sp. PAM 2766]|uniref:N-formylglutamate amidohydrolase n=1 Tax=Rhodococcus parequi TaxID=3137122 RepID=A0ABW9FH58_9NOCA
MTGTPLFLAAGTEFTFDDLVFHADRDNRTLDQALAEADLLVSCPHSGYAIPEEVAPFLAPEFTRRLQCDFTDMSTGPIVRRWAEIDSRIVYVENPHPRMIRDPNRARPADLEASLREAFTRVRKAGPGNAVDLTGVDAVRPVTFLFFPLLREPTDDAGWKLLAGTFTEVAERGLGVYERTRDALLTRMAESALTRGSDFTTLSFHDTMNHTTRHDGSVNVPRPVADRLPDVVALSNRGNHEGNPRGDNPVTMDPKRIRMLAQAHRKGFADLDPNPDAVLLNQPYLGSQEIIAAGARLGSLRPDATAAGIVLSAVQAEFRREFLLGDRITAELMEPGVDWPTADPGRIDRLAHACKASWDLYRAM